jgi:dolichol kinase
MERVLTEIRRKSVHLIEGVILATLYWFDVITPWHFAALFLLAITIIFTYRLTMHWKQPLFSWFFLLFERKEARKKRDAGESAVQYHLGLALAVLLFPKEAAIAGIIILAVGDSIAMWYGMLWGRLPLPLEQTERYRRPTDCSSSLHCFVTSSFKLAYCLSRQSWRIDGRVCRSSKWEIDDNLVIPLVAGVIIILL